MPLQRKSNKTIAAWQERSVGVLVNPRDGHCRRHGWVAMGVFSKGSDSERRPTECCSHKVLKDVSNSSRTLIH